MVVCSEPGTEIREEVRVLNAGCTSAFRHKANLMPRHVVQRLWSGWSGQSLDVDLCYDHGVQPEMRTSLSR